MKKTLLLLSMLSLADAEDLKMQIYKPVTSSCPASWVSDVELTIAKPEITSLTDVKSLKSSIGIPRELYSCNTSILGDYVFEGNVPPAAIKKFMNEKPAGAIGLSLPASQNDEAVKKVYIMYGDKTYKLYGTY
ncbi:MAG: DUF411 domain-containing protein [Sulfuricurvum sp.]|uniref:DUF411 domain-containing protein n=1 Tax=Sulfuricurvum sp. TaxID=2025608 RepID=UPI002634B97D|nr:DUF411 domain-containing protein [Sulfuricurvum sp.]MDD5158754.1 DUF411 domain-containing protein [Sulfuricurvum sp.]